VTYPDAAPPLEPGDEYKLIVEANNRSSSDEPGFGLGFSLLEAKEKKAVLMEEKQIADLGLPEGPTQFLVAHLYATHGLNAEAIERLERVAPKFEETAVERFLGDLHLGVDLPRQAEMHYLKSLDLSLRDHDDEGDMHSRLALASIYGTLLGNYRAASEQLKAAIAIAGKVGDDATIGDARKQLTELK
jgi:hypothetical protein